MMSAEVECKKIPHELSRVSGSSPPSSLSLSPSTLSRCVLLIALALSSYQVDAQPAPRVERALSQQARVTLLASLKPQIAELSREPIYPAGVHPVGSRVTRGRGLWISPQLILSLIHI